MKPEEVNYQPLYELKHATLYVLNNTWKGSLWGLGVLSLAAGVWFSIQAVDPRGIILAMVPVGVLVAHLTRNFKNRVWDEFAVVNGWTFDGDTPLAVLLPPSMQFGHSQHLSPIIQANLAGMVCDMYSYDTTVGEGKSAVTYYFTTALLKLPKTMPHMVLHAKHNDANVQNDLADGQELKLEGDFNDYFRLMIEKNQQIDALTILTPDVMQTLVDYSQNEDVEIVGDNLYLVVKGDKRDAANVEQLIKSVFELGSQLIENARLSGAPLQSEVSQAVVPGTYTLTPSEWSWASLHNPTQKSDLILLLVVSVIVIALFAWLLIGLSRVPQY
ncbi:MAG TPA: hypothetical protein VLG27_00435 [Candidatus Saccharimonadia bacterium]|nr:hypothetical protein [Candidatus Saccharimonadia bacterium]